MIIFNIFKRREDPKILIILLGQYKKFLIKINLNPNMFVKDTLGITA